MKATALGLLALASVLFAGSLSAVAVGEMGPDFKFDKSWNTIEGATKLSDYRERVVLVERWATN
ncbi:MAG: hypothetical protein KBG84_17245 [Planctomycetes bacterium]|nr:hypothetical protein [Planctomycetota bacterium]MCC6149541.1 hypothetical protein [Planctomycetota bacterium]